jgi:hypothetical protein
MKYAQKKTTPDILHKIENIEKDVKELKLSILRDLFPSGKKVISLKGILKGVTITEQARYRHCQESTFQQRQTIGCLACPPSPPHVRSYESIGF